MARGGRAPGGPVLAWSTDAGGAAPPSANRFTDPSPTTAAHVIRSLGARVPLVLDGGPAASGNESTVVHVTGPVPRILLPGAITAEALANELGAAVLTGVRESVPVSGEAYAAWDAVLDRLTRAAA